MNGQGDDVVAVQAEGVGKRIEDDDAPRFSADEQKLHRLSATGHLRTSRLMPAKNELSVRTLTRLHDASRIRVIPLTET